MSGNLYAERISPCVYIGESSERKQTLYTAAYELLELWKGLWIHALETNLFELLQALQQKEFQGHIYYQVYGPQHACMDTAHERAQELVNVFNQFITEEPLCYIASRYLTMEHLMHELYVHLAALPETKG